MLSKSLLRRKSAVGCVTSDEAAKGEQQEQQYLNQKGRKRPFFLPVASL